LLAYVLAEMVRRQQSLALIIYREIISTIFFLSCVVSSDLVDMATFDCDLRVLVDMHAYYR